MKAIKIDVVNKTIEYIETDSSYQSMCAILESNGYDHVRLSRTEMLWVDDEGLLKEKPLGAFKIEGYPTALSGHGLIMGVNSGGYTVDTGLHVEFIKSLVTFVDVSELPEPKITVVSLD